MTLAACQIDAYARRMNTTALACVPADDAWLVTLEDTVLYPEGGGQPSDTGTIAGVRVLHVARGADGALLHRTVAPVAHGPVAVELDWRRRFDHMQQHTGQHLLTAVAHDRFGWATTSFHLNPDRSDIELDVPALSPAQLAALEEAVNDTIRAAHPVRWQLAEPAELAALGVRTRGLPEGHIGPVRLITIEGIDTNTCGGTHVGNTAELQAISLLGAERLRGGTRLSFLVGGRVLAALQATIDRERALTRALHCGPEGHAAAAERIASEAKAADQRVRALLAEVADAEGRALAAGPCVAARHRPEPDLALLDRIARVALELRPDALLLLTGGEPGRPGVFLLAGADEAVAAAGPTVAAILEGRGGGRGGRYQGKAARLDRRDEALAALLAE